MTTSEVITAYLHAIEARDLDGVARLLDDDVQLIVHPNKLAPAGQRCDKAAMRAAGERGKELLTSERYGVRSMIVDGNRAAVLIEWSGVLPDGRTMRAQICSVIETRDGRVWRQEQYDCFEP